MSAPASASAASTSSRARSHADGETAAPTGPRDSTPSKSPTVEGGGCSEVEEDGLMLPLQPDVQPVAPRLRCGEQGRAPV